MADTMPLWVTPVATLCGVVVGVVLTAWLSYLSWNRQRRWDFKREILCDAIKELCFAEAVLANMIRTFKQTNGDSEDGKAKRSEDQQKFQDAIQTFWRVSLLTKIACGRTIGDQFEKIDVNFTLIKNRLHQGEIANAWEVYENIQTEKALLNDLVRKDLNLT